MRMRGYHLRVFSAVPLFALSLGISLAGTARPALAAVTRHRSFAQRHPVATSVAAGVAAHHLAKHSRRHGRGNFAQRHPVLTGVAAGVATHHYLKKHR